MAQLLIEQQDYVIRNQAGFSYEGYVKDMGYVSTFNIPFVAVPNNSQQHYFDSGITSLPVVNMSPAAVIRSHGDDLNKILYDRLVRSDLGELVVNMGRFNYLSIPATATINIGIENLYQSNATFSISCTYVNKFGQPITDKRQYSLDRLPSEFPDVFLDDLYCPNPNNEAISDIFCKSIKTGIKSNMSPRTKSKGPDFIQSTSDFLGKGAGFTSLATSPTELAKAWSYNELVNSYKSFDAVYRQNLWPSQVKQIERGIMSDISSNKMRFLNENNKIVDFPKYKSQWTPMMEQQYNNARYYRLNQARKNWAIEAAEHDYAIENGLDRRTKAPKAKLDKLTKFNKGLNIFGLALSVGTLGYSYYLYRSEYDEKYRDKHNFFYEGDNALLVGDCVFAGLAFVPYIGWIFSGSWFLARTFGIVGTEIQDPNKDNPYRNEIYTGMRRDNTRVDNINREIIEMKSRQVQQDLKDLRTPMKINGYDMGCSVYDFKRRQEKIFSGSRRR